MSGGRVLIFLGFVAILLTFGWNIDFGISSLPRIDGTKVLIIMDDGFDWTEYSDVKNNLIGQGATVLSASYEKKELYGHYGQGPIIPNLTFTEVNVSEYDAFYVPGGLSPENLLTDPRNETLLDLVREANDEYLILSAICHGPWVLANASVVEGKNGTGHSEVEQYWTAAGGIWTYPKMVERDGNLLTARYEGLEEFKEALVTAIAERAHDVAITEVNASKTVVGQGFDLSINVTIANQGGYTEIFNVTVYANTTIIATLANVTLAGRDSTTITFTWNSTDFAYGNYTINAHATPVYGETDTADNTLIGGWVVLTIVGDADVNGLVDMWDFYTWREYFGKSTGEWPSSVNPDIDSDGLVEMPDFYVWRQHFGESG